MDELAARCKKQLATFRIKELKDVLARVGAAKQGKKQVLIDKIMAVVMSPARQQHSQKGFRSGSLFNKESVSREEVAKVIDDIYRKMNGSEAADLASKGQYLIVGSNGLGRSDEQDEVANWAEGKTRCPCGSSIDSGTMIQCDDSKCGVWQHLDCVRFPEKEGLQPEIPSQFYCEICRVQNGDPFCVSLAHPLLPTKLTTSILGSERSSPLQVEKPFVLSHADLELLHKPNHDIQVWCVLLNDKVQLRMQWPAYPDLRVNGVPIRATNRPGQQLLGANGRDDGPGIVTCIREGTNRLSFSAYDSRPFCLGVRIICRLTVPQVLRLVPSQSEGESFDAALARVRRCIGGGAGGGGLGNDEDSDSDLEVVAESVTVNLRCPMSGSRIKVAGRFRPCIHMGCFDLHTFVELNQRTRKWQCPICLKNYSLENLIIDPFFNKISTSMRSYGEDVTEIEMKPDGFWRPKLEGDARLREIWRSPDGSTSLARGAIGSLSEQGNLKPVKLEEDVSMERMPLKIGIKRTQDGIWKVNGTRAPTILAGHSFPGRNSLQRNTFSHSSSATASNNEDPSVNQESSDHHHHSTKNELEANSKLMEPVSAWQTSGSLGGELQPLKNSEVIVLSDTEEEIADDFNIGSSAASGYDGSENVRPTIFAMLPSPEELVEEAHVDNNGIAVAQWNGDHVQGTTERSHTFTEVESVPNTADPPLDFFAGNGNGLNLPADNSSFWDSQQDAPFEFFSSASDAPGPARNHHCGPVRPIAVPAVPRQGYGFSSSHHQRDQGMFGTNFLDHTRLGSASTFLASDCNRESIESTRGLASVDPSLRLSLRPQPARTLVQHSVREPFVASSEGIRDDWFSLSLGGGESILDTSTSTDIAAARQSDHHTQERGRLDSLANTASALLGMCSDGAGDNPRHVQKSRHDVTGHRLTQRTRHYFRVDSDSE